MFTQMNTGNPLGQRPPSRMASPRSQVSGLSGLGADSGSLDPSQESNWNYVLNYLRSWNAQLRATEDSIRAVPMADRGAVIGADLANAVNQNRQDYENISQQYITLHRAVFGEVPTGLSGMAGLGFFDPVTAIALGAGLALLLTGIIVGYEMVQALRAQVEMKKQQTAGSLAAQSQQLVTSAAQYDAMAQQAQASGNTLLAQQYQQQANNMRDQAAQFAGQASGTAQSSTPSTWSAWLQNNAPIIGFAVVGTIVAVSAMKK